MFRRAALPRNAAPRTNPLRTRLSVTPLEDRTNPTTITISAGTDMIEGTDPVPGTMGSFTLHRSDLNAGMAFVSFGGTATAGTDYTGNMMAYTFDSGQYDFTFYLSPIGDSSLEGTETIVITVVTDMMNTYTIGSPSTATLNFYDDETARVTVEKVGGDKTEGESGTFRISRTGSTSGDLTVNFTTGGSATSGTDYTSIGTSAKIASGNSYVDIAVVTKADNVVETGGESATIQITDNGTTYSAYGTSATVSLAIADDPPIMNVSADNVMEAGATGGFTVRRSGGDIASALTMSYSISGTADEEDDFAELPGTIEFEAGEDTAYIPVDAVGDNILDVDETVILTIGDGGTDYVIGDDDNGTVIIDDQPMTVSVLRNADGVENGASPSFKFIRAGDISEELTVTYTVGGTATSAGSADFTALSGSVFFDENEDEVIVTVTLTNDSTVEPTETITATLDEDDDYLIANPSATVMVADDDASTDVYWVSTGSTDWAVASNWSINAVPGKSHHVRFWSSKSNVNCANLGYGLSTVEFAGLYIDNGYSGTITLDEPLVTGTFQLTSASATINQPHSDENITVANSLFWTNGTLNTVDSGASVIMNGAGLIDPPDTGEMSTASTLGIEATSSVSILPGAIDFTGGLGLVIEGKADMIVEGTNIGRLKKSVDVNQAITINSGGELTITKANQAAVGVGTTDLPVHNEGILTVNFGIHWIVNGRLAGVNAPSILQTTGGHTLIFTATAVVAKFGMKVNGGRMDVVVTIDGTEAKIKGFFQFWDGTLAFFHNPDVYGKLNIEGEAMWLGGTYEPTVDGTNAVKTDLWWATSKIFVNIGLGAKVAPQFKATTQGTAGEKFWTILEGKKGIRTSDDKADATPPAIPVALQEKYDFTASSKGAVRVWKLQRLTD